MEENVPHIWKANKRKTNKCCPGTLHNREKEQKLCIGQLI